MPETYRQVVINNRPAQLVDSGYYADIRFDPNDDTPTYIGLHPTRGVSTGTGIEWKIYKFTTVSALTVQIQLAYGVWNDRASLF